MPDIDNFPDTVIDELASKGWCIVPDFISPEQVHVLANETRQLRRKNVFAPAGIGKGAERTVNSSIRGDFIFWLTEPDISHAQREYLERLESLRLAANSGLQLGLFDFEGHLALYPPGSFYSRHLDRFQNDSLRTLTAILYLNEYWQAESGGQLRLYTDGDQYFDVLPQGGTLVLFLAERFWHEVLPASRERLSITGWFKTRSEALL